MPLMPAAESRLRALSERCLGRAAESLSVLMGSPLRLRVAGIDSMSPEALPELVSSQNGRELVAMQFEITGEEAGFLLIVFPVSTVHRLLHRLLPGLPMSGALSPLEHSAVQEVGNILGSAFLSELADLIGRRILPSPPRVQFEDTAELIRELTHNLQRVGSEIVVVQADFEDPSDHIEGRFFVFPELGSIERLTRSAER